MNEIEKNLAFKAARARFLALVRKDAQTATTQRYIDLSKADAEQVAAAGGGLVDNPEYPGVLHDAWEQFFLNAPLHA